MAHEELGDVAVAGEQRDRVRRASVAGARTIDVDAVRDQQLDALVQAVLRGSPQLPGEQRSGREHPLAEAPEPGAAAVLAEPVLEQQHPVIVRAPEMAVVERLPVVGIGAAWSPRLVSPIPWTRAQFLFTDHLGMTKDAAFTDNVLYLLLEEPPERPEE